MTKREILYDSIYMKYKVVKLIKAESRMVFVTGWGEGGKRCCPVGVEFQSCNMETF